MQTTVGFPSLSERWGVRAAGCEVTRNSADCLLVKSAILMQSSDNSLRDGAVKSEWWP